MLKFALLKNRNATHLLSNIRSNNVFLIQSHISSGATLKASNTVSSSIISNFKHIRFSSTITSSDSKEDKPVNADIDTELKLEIIDKAESKGEENGDSISNSNEILKTKESNKLQEDDVNEEEEIFPWMSNTNVRKNDTSFQDTVVDDTLDVNASDVVILGQIRSDDLIKGRNKRRRDHIRNNTNKFFNVFDFQRDVNDLMVFKKNDDDDTSLYTRIDIMKPTDKVISIKRYDQLYHDLDTSFKLSQLKNYAKYKNISSIKKSTKKRKVLTILIEEYWGVNKSSELVTPEEELIVEDTIQLRNAREMFLLLSNRGYLMHLWSRLGANLYLLPNDGELIVRGIKSIVSFVQTSWNKLLNGTKSSRLDLTDLSEFYHNELHKDIPISVLQSNSNVFFDKMTETDELYLVSSFNIENIFLCKGAILVATDYSPASTQRIQYEFINNSNNNNNNNNNNSNSKNNHKVIEKQIIDNSLPWYVSSQPVYRYKQSKERISQIPLISTSLTEENEIDEEVKKVYTEVQYLDKEFKVSDGKFQFNFIKDNNRNDEALEEENDEDIENFNNREFESNFELELDPQIDIDNATENLHELSEGNIINNDNNNNKDKDNVENFTKLIKYEDMFTKLNEFNNDKLININPRDKWLPQNVTVNFGKVLFEKSEKQKQQPQQQQDNQDSQVNNDDRISYFHSNLPEVNSKISELPLLNKEAHLFGSSGGIINQCLYFLQIRLTPDAYSKFDNFLNYPNIEIWIEMDKKKNDLRIVENGSSIYVLERETSLIYPIPSMEYDMKFQSSYNSLLNHDVSENQNDNQNDNKGKNKEKTKLSINNQVALNNLIKKCETLRINFNEFGSLQKFLHSIKTKVNVNTKDETIPYLITNVNLRRSIDIDFDGEDIIYEVVTDHNNNKRYEVTLACTNETNENGEIPIEGFKKFVDNSFKFLKFIN
ncbi:hypothetical protein B5S30_g1840 [[Candida] boidinii]|nr:hypothetical protein B5S30_g1840 [[Candida] boidinii]